MQNRPYIACLVALSVMAAGCSTRPRNFSANISAPVADRMAFENDYRTCEKLVRAGHSSNFKGAAATLATTGVATVGAGAAMMSTGLGGVNIATGAASTSLAAVPVIGILAGFGVSRAIRGGKERKYKRAMGNCLAEYGYPVGTWTKLKKRDDAAAFASANANVVPQPASASAAEELTASTDEAATQVAVIDPAAF
ncbi:hypothetical protein [Erythrobacter mangrovi]|uniref:Glycine zipper family protein n=1 Tax=Erythrobacter mangrovi TaxID=2739433 RepID=A0A7D4BPI0_9SPHN|nr:hypothetical protein [Erythrobacter mangrovi]QKG72004.1 hypothetical protein HQR01_11855 [Erythrobacter mangrovi]